MIRGDGMQETIVFRPIKGTEHLTVNALKVLKVIVEEIGDRADRVDYHLIMRRAEIDEWNQVKYAIRTLCNANVLQKSEGQLKVLKKIVI